MGVLRSSVWDVFINFLLIYATDRRKISSDQKRFFFANTPFKQTYSLPNLSVELLGRDLEQIAQLRTEPKTNRPEW